MRHELENHRFVFWSAVCGLRSVVFLVFICLLASSCARPLATARLKDDMEFFSRDFAATSNDIYYAARWALGECGYPVGAENLQDGFIYTSWLPSKSDTFHTPVFGERDYSVNNSYYRLSIQIVPQEGRTEVKVTSNVKTIVPALKSSGIEEKKILDKIGDYVRKGEPSVTNLGVEE